MQKIVPHLWFDTQAVEAAHAYISIFESVFGSENGVSRLVSSSVLHDTPSGDADVVSFDLLGYSCMAISAGPYFTFNPSISFAVACSSADEAEKLWGKLSDGGKVLMEFGEYPFARAYGWTADKYGLSWQVVYRENDPIPDRITPTLMFAGDQCGNALPAVRYYADVFAGAGAFVSGESAVGPAMYYEKGEEPDKEGTVKYVGFRLAGQGFAAMDSARAHDFGFNEAVSLLVNCENQEEIDYFWERLSAVPEAEQCGWLKDRYGVSWQIAPASMTEMMESNDKEAVARVTQAFLKMKKFDLATLDQAFKGE